MGMEAIDFPIAATGHARGVTLRNNRFVGFKYCLEVVKTPTTPYSLGITAVDNVVQGNCGIWDWLIEHKVITANGDYVDSVYTEEHYDIRGNMVHVNPYKGLCSCQVNK